MPTIRTKPERTPEAEEIANELRKLLATSNS